MKTPRNMLIFILLGTICQTIYGQGVPLWPMPSSISWGLDDAIVNASTFKIYIAAGSKTNPILEAAIDRYSDLLFWNGQTTSSDCDCGDNVTPLSSLSVSISDASQTLTYGTDESYTLDVNSDGTSTLVAKNVFGAMRGLETFSQLLESPRTSCYCVYLTPVSVQDTPRFMHRGVLLDTSRHYLSLTSILRTIDAMSFSKLNVLHWHIVDAESFPFQVPSFPNMTEGAWKPNLIYTPQDVKGVVSYALQRGVRVIPEYDTPGHTDSWGAGYPITTVCPDYSSNVNNVNLNPTIQETYDVLTGVWSEACSVFSDSYVHIGGDEVVYGCWKDDPSITAWMQQNGITSYNQLMQYYENRLWGILAPYNKTMIAWQEIFDSYGLTLPNNIVIEVWEDTATLQSVAKAGLRGILAYGWYLNQLSLTWQQFYSNEPFSGSGWTTAMENLIIGGEASAWAELINDQNLDQVIWPRAACTGERLWSPSYLTSTSAAQPRLVSHICRLNRRGIAATPIVPNVC